MFGDEPYGNYNRILLSQRAVPARRPTREIFLNSDGLVRRERHHPARRGAGRPYRPVRASWCTPTTARSRRYDKLILATGSRSFFPPMDGLCAPTTTTLPPGVFAFRTLDDTRGDDRLRAARRPPQGGRDRRRAARPGGRTRAADTTACTSTSCTPAQHLMNAQLDARPAAILRRSGGGPRHRGAHRHAHHRRCVGDGRRCAGVWFADGRAARLRHGGRRRRHPAERRPGRDQRASPWSAAIVVDDQMRSVDDDRTSTRRRVRAAPRRGLRPGRAAVGAGRGARRPRHRRRPAAPPTTGPGPRPSSRSPASTSPRWASQAPERADDEFVVVLRAPARRLQVASSSATASSSAPRCSATCRKVAVPDAGVRPRACRCPRSGWSCCSTSARPTPRSGVAELADDAQVCNCNGVTKGALVACVRGGDDVGVRGDGQDQGRARAAAPARQLVAQIVEWAAGGAVERGPVGELVRARVSRWTSRTLMARDPRTATCIRCPRCSPRWRPDGEPRTRSPRWGWPRCCEMMWGDEYVDETRRPVHQRPGARQHPARRHVLGGPADEGRRHHPGAAAPDRRRRREVRRCRWSSCTGGQRIDLLGIRKEDLPGGLGRPRHAVRLRLRQELPDREDLCGQRLLPLRAWAIRPRWASRSRTGSRAWRARPR